MPRMNKKGFAEVIAVIAIILVSISAIAIFAAGFLREAYNLSPEISCAQIKIDNPVKVQRACLNHGENRIEIRIKRELNDRSIQALTFTALQDSLKESWQCGNLCGECELPEKGATQTYYLNLEDTTLPTTLTISGDGCALEFKQLAEC